jgi:hypothetical protein
MPSEHKKGLSMNTLLIGLAALPLLAGIASAGQPTLLGDAQMDRLTAGQTIEEILPQSSPSSTTIQPIQSQTPSFPITLQQMESQSSPFSITLEPTQSQSTPFSILLQPVQLQSPFSSLMPQDFQGPITLH